MGIVCQGMYVSGMVDVFQTMNAIKNCIERVKKGDADAALLRWFGDSSADFKKEIGKKLDKMRAVINLQDVQVSFRTMAEQDVTENAAALPGSATSIVPGTTSNYQGAQVLLNLNFTKLKSYLPLTGAGLIDASGFNQSRFETFLHELTHAILSTTDEALANGNTAYGAQQALALVGESSDKAKLNAENWGIFIEACGFHKTS